MTLPATVSQYWNLILTPAGRLDRSFGSAVRIGPQRNRSQAAEEELHSRPVRIEYKGI